MDKLSEQEFEKRVRRHRKVFFQLYGIWEELNESFDVAKSLEDLSILQIEDSFKAFPNATGLIKMFGSQDRYESCIYYLATAAFLFTVFGPGGGEKAFATTVAIGRERLVEEGGENNG